MMLFAIVMVEVVILMTSLHNGFVNRRRETVLVSIDG